MLHQSRISQSQQENLDKAADMVVVGLDSTSSSRDDSVLAKQEQLQDNDGSVSSGSNNVDKSVSSNSSSVTGTRSGLGSSSAGDAFDDYVGKDGAGRNLGTAKKAILVCLLSLAAVTGWLWYKYATEYQEDGYRQDFQQHAEKAIATFLNRVEYRATAAASFATSLSTQAVGAGMTWPFVGFTHFERRAAASRRLTSSKAVFYSPVVEPEVRSAWETYAVNNEYFLKSNFTDPFLQDESQADDPLPYRQADWDVQDGIFRFENGEAVAQEIDADAWLFPVWQSSPIQTTAPVGTGIAMFNQPSEELRSQALKGLEQVQTVVFSMSLIVGSPDSMVESYADGAHVYVYAPIFRDLVEQRTPVVGSLTLDIGWGSFWEGSVHGIPAPLTMVLENTCSQQYTYQLGTDESTTTFVAEGTKRYQNKLELSMASTYEDFADRLDLDVESDDVDLCYYRVIAYPTKAFEEYHLTGRPLFAAIGIAAIFVVTAAVFICYDHFITVRQKKVLEAAKRSTAIVKSLFPAGIRNRLLDEARSNNRFEKMLPEDYAMMETPKLRLQSYLAPSASRAHMSRHTAAAGIFGSEPIAEFFPATTIMFADLSGFTAWSSTREPAQVFMLLETLYGAMDKAARKLDVFKLETIGDCYVAATGMPDPRPDHAVIMAKFANTSLAQIKDLTGALESQLGPGTGDLAFRIGLHSGPVTGGVLRGEKSRFQLFGDTMATASKMESSGKAGRIHISKETADLLIADGKESWIEKSGNAIATKGRGAVPTFWLKTNFRKVHKSAPISPLAKRSSKDDVSSPLRESATDFPSQSAVDVATGPRSSSVANVGRRASRMSWELDVNTVGKIERLVDYNAEVMVSLLKKIVARRSAVQDVSNAMEETTRSGSIALDEVKEVIEMPKYSEEAAVKMASDYTIEIPDVVRSEMREYIRRIASLYHGNSFHNFEHASHVALSANKLMKRIVMPEDVNYRKNSKEKVIEKVLAVAKDLHEATLGISSDPVAQFAVVFSALIHDVDHPGVPNGILAKEEPETAKKYQNKSIAEQRSIDIAWEILLDDDFKNLRRCMFPSEYEYKHFRALTVNCVMATDIFDKELGALRKSRWQKCFHPEKFPFPEGDKTDAFNRKATIVLEHIIQASDVAHTMQHWHVYIKWNEQLFREMYTAYKEGRSDVDPSTEWYKGEIWFFDNYVLPLAHKLKECGVFGVSSAEYLIYAKENRSEWERKGMEICKQMLENFEELQTDQTTQVGVEEKSSS